MADTIPENTPEDDPFLTDAVLHAGYRRAEFGETLRSGTLESWVRFDRYDNAGRLIESGERRVAWVRRADG